MKIGWHQTNRLLFALMIIVCFSLFTNLFYKMATCDYENAWTPYYSDIIFHIRSSMTGDSYSLMGLIMQALYMLPYDTASFLLALFLSAIELLTVFSVYMLLLELDKVADRKTREIDRAAYLWLSLLSLFIVSIYIPDVLPSYYFRALSMTCWQNDTYFAMRPIAILTLLFLIKIYNKFDEKRDKKELLLFGLSLFLSTWMKPSFFIAFAPVLFIIAIWRLAWQKNKIDEFKRQLTLAAYTVPAVICLLIQNKVVYVDSSEDSIIFDPFFMVNLRVIDWHLALALTLLFPIIITVLENKSLLKKEYFAYIVIWLIWIIENFYAFFLAESGTRLYDFNFVWGITISNSLLYIGSYYVWYNRIRLTLHEKTEFIKGHRKLSNSIFAIYCTFGASLLLYLAYVGIEYFTQIYNGMSFVRL